MGIARKLLSIRDEAVSRFGVPPAAIIVSPKTRREFCDEMAPASATDWFGVVRCGGVPVMDDDSMPDNEAEVVVMEEVEDRAALADANLDAAEDAHATADDALSALTKLGVDEILKGIKSMKLTPRGERVKELLLSGYGIADAHAKAVAEEEAATKPGELSACERIANAIEMTQLTPEKLIHAFRCLSAAKSVFVGQIDSKTAMTDEEVDDIVGFVYLLSGLSVPARLADRYRDLWRSALAKLRAA